MCFDAYLQPHAAPNGLSLARRRAQYLQCLFDALVDSGQQSNLGLGKTGSQVAQGAAGSSSAEPVQRNRFGLAAAGQIASILVTDAGAGGRRHVQPHRIGA